MFRLLTKCRLFIFICLIPTDCPVTCFRHKPSLNPHHADRIDQGKRNQRKKNPRKFPDARPDDELRQYLMAAVSNLSDTLFNLLNRDYLYPYLFRYLVLIKFIKSTQRLASSYVHLGS